MSIVIENIFVVTVGPLQASSGDSDATGKCLRTGNDQRFDLLSLATAVVFLVGLCSSFQRPNAGDQLHHITSV